MVAYETANKQQQKGMPVEKQMSKEFLKNEAKVAKVEGRIKNVKSVRDALGLPPHQPKDTTAPKQTTTVQQPTTDTTVQPKDTTVKQPTLLPKGTNPTGMDINEGGSSIPYWMEDPYLKEEYLGMLSQNGAENRMKPEYYDKNYKGELPKE